MVNHASNITQTHIHIHAHTFTCHGGYRAGAEGRQTHIHIHTGIVMYRYAECDPALTDTLSAGAITCTSLINSTASLLCARKCTYPPS